MNAVNRPNQPDAPLTYTIDQTAVLLGVSRASAYKAASAGQIPVLRVGRRYVVPRAALDALLQPAKAAA